MLTIRPAEPADLPEIAAIAVANGQDHDWSARNPAYVQHLVRHARMLVAESAGQLTGFGAAQQVGPAAEPVTMLCDLFVDPAAHGSGTGRAILARLWDAAPRRITFSSTHPHALPLYTSFGLDAWWPLLYLGGDSRALRAQAGWGVAAADPAHVSGLELDWTGADRGADHRAWAARPNGGGLVVTWHGAAMAAGTAAGPDGDYGLMHLVTSPAADDPAATAAVIAALAGLVPPGRVTNICLPAPHPAVRLLLAHGWRVSYLDQFMASAPGLLDPRRAVPSPGQA